ncbi:MAG: hypothetical protein AB4062_18220 [Crocosphaera sp.]
MICTQTETSRKTTKAKKSETGACSLKLSRLAHLLGLIIVPNLILPRISSAALPMGGIDMIPGFFNLEVEFIAGPNQGQTYSVPNMFDPEYLFSRGDPFIDGGLTVDDMSVLPIPSGFDVPSIVKDSDISSIPDGFNGTQLESLHHQMLSLNAQSADGLFRLVAGQTLKNEFPSIFEPSLGLIVEDNDQQIEGFFNLYGIVVTPVETLIIGRGEFAEAVLADIVVLDDEAPFPFIFFPDPNAGTRLAVSLNDPDGPAIAEVRVTSPNAFVSIPEPSSILGLAVFSSSLLLVKRSSK